MSAGAAVRLARPGGIERRRPTWTYWAVLVPTFAAVVGFGGVYSYVWAPVDVALFVALITYLWKRSSSGRPLIGHPIMLPMAGFGLLVAVQWKWHLSAYPGATLTELVQLAGCGAAFYLSLVTFRTASSLLRLGHWLWLFCGALATEAVLQQFGANGYIYWFHNASYATPVGPFVYHNFYAGCMDLLMPIAVVFVVRKGRGGEPVWALWLRRGLVPALALISVVISQSRGGLLVMLIEAILGVVVFWPDLRRRRGGRLGLMAGAAGLLAFSLLANWGPVNRRFAGWDSHDASTIERLAVDQSTLHIFRDHVWLGTGFGTFASIYPAYQTFDSGLMFQNAHNDFLQTLAETGTAGMICVLGFLGIWAWAFWRCWSRHEHHGPVRNTQLAAFVATAGFLVHSYGDFQFHAPGNALLFFILAAAAFAVPARVQHKSA